MGLTLELHWCVPPTLDELFSNEANTKLTSNLDSRSNDDIINTLNIHRFGLFTLFWQTGTKDFLLLLKTDDGAFSEMAIQIPLQYCSDAKTRWLFV